MSEDGQAFVFGRTHDFRGAIRLGQVYGILPWLVDGINAIGGRHAVEAMEPAMLNIPGETVRSIYCCATLTVLTMGKLSSYVSNYANVES